MSQWYFAHEGRQHGPLPVFELETLAEQGDFDPESDLVWREGMAEWRPASEFPELRFEFRRDEPDDPDDPFASDNPDASDDPYAAPRTPETLEPGPTPAELPEIDPGSERLPVGPCLGRAFTLAKSRLGPIFLTGLCYLVLIFASALIFQHLDELAGYEAPAPPPSTGNAELDELLLAASNQGSPVRQLLSTFVEVFLGLGLVRFSLNIIDGKSAALGDLFSQGRRLFRGFVAHFLFTLMVGIGLILLIVPGVYLFLRFGFYQCAIVDRDLGVIDSFRLSSRITRGSKWPLLGVAVLSLLIVAAGALALGIGLAFAIPVTALVWSLAFRFLLHGSAVLSDPAP